MGAELVGYLVIGPKRISKSAIRASVRRVRQLKEIAERVIQETGKGTCVSAEQAYVKPLREVAKDLNMDCDIAEYATNFIDIDPAAAVQEFVDFWNDPGCRDTTWRLSFGRKIVFAGDQTWGDEPEGYGYTQVKKAHIYGFATVIGLE